MSESVYRSKVIVVGDPNIGKTSLIRRFVQSKFTNDYIPTLGTNICNQPVNFEDNGNSITMQMIIWDLAGQPAFDGLHSSFIQGSHGVIVMFDLTRAETFVNARNWINEVLKYELPIESMILVGNKADLEENIVVSQEEVDQLKEEFQIPYYYQTSPRTGDNVPIAFEMLARSIYNSIKEVYHAH